VHRFFQGDIKRFLVVDLVLGFRQIFLREFVRQPDFIAYDIAVNRFFFSSSNKTMIGMIPKGKKQQKHKNNVEPKKVLLNAFSADLF